MPELSAVRPPHQQPLRAVRLAEIAAIIEADGAVRTADVARRFSVSEMTARRDLAAVAAAQGYTRVHGGLLRAAPPRPGGR